MNANLKVISKYQYGAVRLGPNVHGYEEVMLHELAHSVVAMRFGLRVVDITLWPLGGIARMSEMPESSRIEGWVAIAGPTLAGTLVAVRGLARTALN